MPRYLVAYYSLTGTTAKVAQALAAKLGADLEPIRDVKARRGRLGSVLEAVFKLRPRIQPPARNLADYSVVVLGGPVWAHNMASPLRSYVTRERARLGETAIFCTEMGSGGEAVLRQMEALSGRTPPAGLMLADADLRSAAGEAKIDGFVEQVRRAAEGGAGRPARAA